MCHPSQNKVHKTDRNMAFKGKSSDWNEAQINFLYMTDFSKWRTNKNGFPKKLGGGEEYREQGEKK